MATAEITVSVLVDGVSYGEFPMTRRLEGLVGVSGETRDRYTSSATAFPQTGIVASSTLVVLVKGDDSAVTVVKSNSPTITMNAGGMICSFNGNLFASKLSSTPTADVTTILAGNVGSL